MILKLALDLPDDGVYVPLTRHFGRVLLEYLKVVRDDIGAVDMIVTELVSNVIRHAHSSSGRFQIVLEYYAQRVDITVIDAGQGFMFRELPEVGTVRPDIDGGMRLGGFGLPLLDSLSDCLEFYRTDPHGTTVCAEKHLRYETQTDSDAADEMSLASGGNGRVLTGALVRWDARIQKAQLQAANAELGALVTTDHLTGLLNYRSFQLRLSEEAAHVQRTAAMVLLDVDNFGYFNDAYGHAVGDGVLRTVAARLKGMCGACDDVARFGGDEFTILMPDVASTTTSAEVEARVQAGLDGLSFIVPGAADAIPIFLSVGAALLPAGEDDWHQVLEQAQERLRRVKTGGDVEVEADRVRTEALHSYAGFSMLDALVTAVDNKDRYTRKHSEDVMKYSLAIARELGMDSAGMHTVAVAALLHDVGKIGVPDAILRKPGKLTEEEFAVVKQHPQMGAVMVGAVGGLDDTLDAVRHHHERWDGGGYPLGLHGAETPLIARVMSVADAFCAMTTHRPYRDAIDKQKALSILSQGAGTQWDPACVQAFLMSQSELKWLAIAPIAAGALQCAA
jgi:diguanylate cyclase (GGDEF)-like protein/putative nucleotidyltransferase with HDIG domain